MGFSFKGAAPAAPTTPATPAAPAATEKQTAPPAPPSGEKKAPPKDTGAQRKPPPPPPQDTAPTPTPVAPSERVQRLRAAYDRADPEARAAIRDALRMEGVDVSEPAMPPPEPVAQERADPNYGRFAAPTPPPGASLERVDRALADAEERVALAHRELSGQRAEARERLRDSVADEAPPYSPAVEGYQQQFDRATLMRDQLRRAREAVVGAQNK